MRVTSQYGKLDVDNRSGFVACPICGNPRLTRVRQDTSATNLPAHCKRCKTEFLLNIEGETRALDARVLN